MSFKRSVIKNDNSFELRILNKSGRTLYAIIICEYGSGVISNQISSVRAINLGMTNRAFRYELSRFSTMPIDLLESETEEDLFEIS